CPPRRRRPRGGRGDVRCDAPGREPLRSRASPQHGPARGRRRVRRAPGRPRDRVRAARDADMKITAVETHVCNARMRNWIFVRVVTDQDGLFGWGEATLEWHTRAVVGAIEGLPA